MVAQWSLILLIVWFGVFLVTRWFWLWYFRINEIVRLLRIISGENPEEDPNEDRHRIWKDRVSQGRP
jgi:hypothetical protein